MQQQPSCPGLRDPFPGSMPNSVFAHRQGSSVSVNNPQDSAQPQVVQCPDSAVSSHFAYRMMIDSLKINLCLPLQKFLYRLWTLSCQNMPRENPYLIMKKHLEDVPSWNEFEVKKVVASVCNVDTNQDPTKWQSSIHDTTLTDILHALCYLRTTLIMMARVDTRSQPQVTIRMPTITSFIHRIYINVSMFVYENIADYCRFSQNAKGLLEPCMLSATTINTILDSQIEHALECHLPIGDLISKLFAPILYGNQFQPISDTPLAPPKTDPPPVSTSTSFHPPTQFSASSQPETSENMMHPPSHPELVAGPASQAYTAPPPTMPGNQQTQPSAPMQSNQPSPVPTNRIDTSEDSSPITNNQHNPGPEDDEDEDDGDDIDFDDVNQ